MYTWTTGLYFTYVSQKLYLTSSTLGCIDKQRFQHEMNEQRRKIYNVGCMVLRHFPLDQIVGIVNKCLDGGGSGICK